MVRYLVACTLIWAAAAQNPPGLRFEVSVVNAQPSYHIGERITLRHCFSSDRDKTYTADSMTQDRIGRQNGTETYDIEPAANVADPLRGTGREGGGMGGISGGNAILSSKPFCFERDLNEYVRFLKPDTYRLRVRTERVQQIANPTLPERRLHLERGKPVKAVSNPLELRIAPSTREWLAAEMASIRARLDATEQTQQVWDAQAAARRELRYLFTHEAALEMLNRFGADAAFDYYIGLVSSPFRAAMLPELERRIVMPGWPLDFLHIECMDQLWRMATYPRPIPYSQNMTEAERKAAERESRSQMDRQTEYEDAQIARVAALLDRKQPQAAGRTAHTLICYIHRYPWRPAPAWSRVVTSFVMKHFETFDAASQDLLLEGSWADIKSPALAPVLENLLAASQRVERRSEILIRLAEIDPDRARRLTLEMLRNGTWDFGYQLTRALPDSMPPEIDGLLASAYGKGQAEALIVRYGGPGILPQVRAHYEERRAQLAAANLPQACVSPINFYFLRVDPAYGRWEIERQLDTPSVSPPGCIDLGGTMRDLGPWAYSPALEELANPLLTNPSVPVKRGAADVLGWYGSPKAEKPLWSTFEYWHHWWQGRAEELKNGGNDENVRFESSLRSALAQAGNWLLSAEEWRRLAGLCITDWCVSEVKDWERKSTVRPEIVLPDLGPSTYFGSIGPFQAMSEEQFWTKVRQYPQGTVFEWSNTNRNPADYELWRERFAAARMKLKRPPTPDL